MRGFLKRTPVNTLLTLVRKHSNLLPSEDIPTVEASGRILAEETISPANVPEFERSAMDGYALNAEATFGATSYNPLMFKVVGQVTPGDSFQGILKSEYPGVSIILNFLFSHSICSGVE